MEPIDPIIKIVIETVEYYLSDKNLETDKFFNEKLTKNNGKVSIDDILSCNKIKKAKVDKKKLIDIIGGSEKIKVSEDQLFLFRIGNPKIPELKLGGKRVQPEVDDPSIFVDKDMTNPFVLKIEGPKKSEVGWREIEDEFRKIFPDYKIIYSRFKDGEGHLAISSYKKEDKLKEEKFSDLKLKNDIFKFLLLDEKEKKLFWENHGSHFKSCLEKKITISKRKQKKAAKEQKTSGPVKASFGGYIYNDLSKVRSKARTILNLKKNSETLDESEFKFIMDILKYHPNKNKNENVEKIIVDLNPDFKSTRCFFIVRKDGTKEDFSVQKCLENYKNNPSLESSSKV